MRRVDEFDAELPLAVMARRAVTAHEGFPSYEGVGRLLDVRWLACDAGVNYLG